MSYSAVHDAHIAENGGGSSSSIYVGSYLGEIEVSVCSDCEYEEIACTHLRCEWNTEKTVYFCTLCGTDCT